MTSTATRRDFDPRLEQLKRDEVPFKPSRGRLGGQRFGRSFHQHESRRITCDWGFPPPGEEDRPFAPKLRVWRSKARGDARKEQIGARARSEGRQEHEGCLQPFPRPEAPSAAPDPPPKVSSRTEPSC
jgi:hypothetical protein